MDHTISKKWGAPKGYVSCPDCGREYGHHNTKVDPLSELCSACAKERNIDVSFCITAAEFVRVNLGQDKI